MSGLFDPVTLNMQRMISGMILTKFDVAQSGCSFLIYNRLVAADTSRHNLNLWPFDLEHIYYIVCDVIKLYTLF